MEDDKWITIHRFAKSYDAKHEGKYAVIKRKLYRWIVGKNTKLVKNVDYKIVRKNIEVILVRSDLKV